MFAFLDSLTVSDVANASPAILAALVVVPFVSLVWSVWRSVR